MEKINTAQPLFPHLPERLAGLEELAENLWWSWNPGARMLFKTLDRQAWKECIQFALQVEDRSGTAKKAGKCQTSNDPIFVI